MDFITAEPISAGMFVYLDTHGQLRAVPSWIKIGAILFAKLLEELAKIQQEAK